MDYDVVIIGAGPAGYYAAKAVSQRKRKLLLAGAEPYLPYWRPRLPEVIRTGQDPESILMSGKDWFSENGVEIQLSKMAVRIDAAQKKVQWSDGDSTSYGSLILSCGSLPNRSPFPFEGKVFPLRSYQDAMDIRQRCAAGKKAFIIGGGSLGLETAFALVKTGCHVAVSVHSYPLSRQLDSEGGKFLAARLKESGITICCGDLANYEAEIDKACVIAATGVHPDLTLAEKCGIKVSRGILVDEKMRTNLQGIYACGDIAEYNGTIPGLMSVAVKQGETAGINASGGDMVYQTVLPAPLTKVAGLTVSSFGSLKLLDDTQIYRKVSADSYAAIAVRSSKIVGAAFIGNVALGTKLKKWMEAEKGIGKAASFEEIEKLVG
ncbi:putative oxidoreductase [Oscillibacter valericigenes Sjm18-20]|nr:putative oxidoreductase [Oscillibacter valericigenes Sjm18-20]